MNDWTMHDCKTIRPPAATPPSLPLVLQRDSQGTQGGVTQENSRERAFGRSVSPISLLLHPAGYLARKSVSITDKLLFPNCIFSGILVLLCFSHSHDV